MHSIGATHEEELLMKNPDPSLQKAHDRVAERTRNSPEGMRITAQDLRKRAREMRNATDRDAMSRIASGYERRADELAERLKARVAK
jgi:hypothetical protein